MSPIETIAHTFLIVAPTIVFISKQWNLQAAINLSAIVCVGLLATVLLTGCGESVSESHQNEKRDETISTVDQRLNELDTRVLVLEKDARHEENTK